MGTYYIPRDYRGESRILYIFTVKSLISTVCGALVGLIFFGIFSLVSLKIIGIIFLALFSLIGYAVGTFKIPTINAIPVTKRIGGEPVSEIIMRYIKFKKNKKMYIYAKKEEK